MFDRIDGQTLTLVFNQLSAPASQGSVFNRLTKHAGQEKATSFPQRRLALERLKVVNESYGENQLISEGQRLVDQAKDDQICSLIPSRMKRHSKLDVSSNGQLKVTQHTVIHTSQCLSHHVAVEEVEREVDKEVPPLENRGQATINDLKKVAPCLKQCYA